MKPILCLKQICTHIFVYAEARNNEWHISGSFIFIKMHLIQLNKVKGLISFLIINDLLDSINLTRAQERPFGVYKAIGFWTSLDKPKNKTCWRNKPQSHLH